MRPPREADDVEGVHHLDGLGNSSVVAEPPPQVESVRVRSPNVGEVVRVLADERGAEAL